MDMIQMKNMLMLTEFVRVDVQMRICGNNRSGRAKEDWIEVGCDKNEDDNVRAKRDDEECGNYSRRKVS